MPKCMIFAQLHNLEHQQLTSDNTSSPTGSDTAQTCFEIVQYFIENTSTLNVVLFFYGLEPS